MRLAIPIWILVIGLCGALPTGLLAEEKAQKIQLVPQTLQLDKPNRVYDFGGATLKWTGAGDCSQTENMPPMFNITAKGVTLRNATIIGAPDGIHIHTSNVTLENLIFPDVCEDAVTFKRGARAATVRHCRFANAEDKAIQASYGRMHRIHHCHFENCTRPLRGGPETGARFYQNTLVDCHSAVRANGRSAVIIMWGNRFERVRHPVQRLEGAKIVISRSKR